MSGLPDRLSPGQRLSAHWLNRLLDYLRSRELRAGPGARLDRTPSGTTLSLAHAPAPGPAADGGDACVLAEVAGATEGGMILADVPGVGRVVAVCPMMNGETRLDVGDTIVLHACQVREYDGEDASE